MIGFLLCVLGLASAFAAGSRSFAGGTGVVLGWGYAYGIIRANLLDGAAHFIFDAVVLGFFLARFLRPLAPAVERRSVAAKQWLLALMAWPALLVLLPFDNLLIQLVGLRYGVYFLPFFLLGARAEDGDPSRIGRWLAVLNLGALAVGIAEYHLGVQSFFPRNSLTGLIYLSDVAGTGQLRIPSTFPHSHGYGGTMVLTLPFLFHAYLARPSPGWTTVILSGIVAAFVGLFLSASRSSAVIAGLSMALLLAWHRSDLVEGRGFGRAMTLLILAAGTTLAVVSTGNERLLRFQELADADVMSERLASDKHVESLVDTLLEYPLGNGLSRAVGVSIPYFLRGGSDEPERIGRESEFIRVAATQGIVGFFLWIRFLVWFFSRPPRGRGPRALPRSFMYFLSLACIVSGFWSVGLLNAVPAAPLLFVTMGFLARAPLVRPPALSVRSLRRSCASLSTAT